MLGVEPIRCTTFDRCKHGLNGRVPYSFLVFFKSRQPKGLMIGKIFLKLFTTSALKQIKMICSQPRLLSLISLTSGGISPLHISPQRKSSFPPERWQNTHLWSVSGYPHIFHFSTNPHPESLVVSMLI